MISNHDVDTSNHEYYQWRFYRKEHRNPTELNSKSIAHAPRYYPADWNIATNDGSSVRSHQEQYIYNSMLEEDGLTIHYERPFGIKGYDKIPDFTIVVLQSGTVYQWEHFGMMDDPSYALYADEKLQWYIDKGYRFIENGGRLIVTHYRDEASFHNDFQWILGLLKTTH